MASSCRRRHRRAGGLGHGAHALPGPRARVDRGGGALDHPLQHVVGGADRSDRCSAASPASGSAANAPPTAAGHIAMPVSRTRRARRARGVFCSAGRLAGRCAASSGSSGVALFDAFYRSGALVFGGGHVVLPLLREAFVAPGWVSDDAFLAGYGAAQAVPGPALHLRRLSGHGRQADAARHRRCGARPVRHFSSGHADPARRLAVLGQLPQARQRAGRDARRQRRRCRAVGRGALQSGLDQLGQSARRFRASRLSALSCSRFGARRRSWSSS